MLCRRTVVANGLHHWLTRRRNMCPDNRPTVDVEAHLSEPRSATPAWSWFGSILRRNFVFLSLTDKHCHNTTKYSIMADLQYYSYPGVGTKNRELYSYSQAVRVGDIIHCSGQGKSPMASNGFRTEWSILTLWLARRMGPWEERTIVPNRDQPTNWPSLQNCGSQYQACGWQGMESGLWC